MRLLHEYGAQSVLDVATGTGFPSVRWLSTTQFSSTMVCRSLITVMMTAYLRMALQFGGVMATSAVATMCVLFRIVLAEIWRVSAIPSVIKAFIA